MRTVTWHITAAATLGSGGWTSFWCWRVRGNIKSVSMHSSFFQCHLNPRSNSTCHTDHTLTVSRNALNHPIARYGGPPICLPIPSHYAWHATTQCSQPGVQPGSVCGSNPLNMLTSPLSFSFSSKWLVLESSFMSHYPTQFRYAFFFLSFFSPLLIFWFDVVITCTTVPVCCATVYIMFHRCY